MNLRVPPKTPGKIQAHISCYDSGPGTPAVFFLVLQCRRCFHDAMRGVGVVLTKDPRQVSVLRA